MSRTRLSDEEATCLRRYLRTKPASWTVLHTWKQMQNMARKDLKMPGLTLSNIKTAWNNRFQDSNQGNGNVKRTSSRRTGKSLPASPIGELLGQQENDEPSPVSRIRTLEMSNRAIHDRLDKITTLIEHLVKMWM